MTNPLLLKIAGYSYPGIFASMCLGILGLPIPDETIVAFVGFLAFKGKLSLFPAAAAVYAGTICGITVGYLLGRFLGSPFLEKYAAHLHISHEHLEKARAFYVRYGKFALLIGYFIPVIRHLTAIFAGISLMPYRTFAPAAYSGGLLWTVTFVSAGYLFAEKWSRITTYSMRYILPAALFISAVLVVSLWKKAAGKRRRESH